MTTQKPEISVLMPIYNTNPVFLRAAIESILNQTKRNFEFLILNDSPNNTELDKIVASYQDDRIHYFKNEKSLGIADGHTFLLEKARGTYIALMDHDDISRPQRLEMQLHFLKTHPEIGLCGTACHRFGKLFKTGDIISSPDPDTIEASLLFKCPILHPSIMARTSCLKENNITWDNRFISLNDRKLYFDLSKKTKLANLTQVLYDYRLSSSMTSKTKREQIQQERHLFQQIYLEHMGADLTPEELSILQNYVLKGRCRIKDKAILAQVAGVLNKLVAANQKSHFVPDQAFQKICARYLIKRCKNAAFYGRVPCYTILKDTKLPVKIPVGLRLYMGLERLLGFHE